MWTLIEVLLEVLPTNVTCHLEQYPQCILKFTTFFLGNKDATDVFCMRAYMVDCVVMDASDVVASASLCLANYNLYQEKQKSGLTSS